MIDPGELCQTRYPNYNKIVTMIISLKLLYYTFIWLRTISINRHYTSGKISTRGIITEVSLPAMSQNKISDQSLQYKF